MSNPHWFDAADELHRAILATAPAERTCTPYTEDDLARLALGLVGEAGEVAQDIKKYLRGDFDNIELFARLEAELADVRVYVELMHFALRRLNGAAFPDTDAACAAKLAEVVDRWRAKGVIL